MADHTDNPNLTIVFEAKGCPNCKCKDKLSTKIFEVAKKETPTGGYTCLKVQVSPLDNPDTSVLTVRLLQVFHDGCAKCGTEYISRVAIVKAPMPANINIPGFPGGIPFAGQGR